MKGDSLIEMPQPPSPAANEGALRALAGQSILLGRLPGVGAARIWGGPGGGGQCALCEQPIGGGDLEMELEFDDPLGGPPSSLCLHVRCCAAWEAARREKHFTIAGGTGVLKANSADGRIPAREPSPPTRRGTGE